MSIVWLLYQAQRIEFKEDQINRMLLMMNESLKVHVEKCLV